LDVS